MRVCCACKIGKDISEFYANSHKANKSKMQTMCKKCQSESYAKNLYGKKDYVKRYTGAPGYKEKKREYDKRRREMFGEKFRAYEKARSKQPKRLASARDFTARKRSMTMQWKSPIVTPYQKRMIKLIYRACTAVSKISGKKYQVDHIIPLRGKTVCGLHCLKNLRIITAAENIKKGNKLILEGTK